jgi:hypothetical protein
VDGDERIPRLEIGSRRVHHDVGNTLRRNACGRREQQERGDRS